MIVSTLIISAVILLGAAGIITCARRAQWDRDLLKDFVVPLYTPFVVAVLTVGFGFMSEKQKNVEADNQKKVELLRQVVASDDRPDIAFLTAVGDQMVLRLRRYRATLKKEVEEADATRKGDLAGKRDFEEKAAFFFYGMFRVALTDLYATKGYQLYPRLWMEEAFYGLASQVVDTVNGGRKETDPDLPAREESALYKFFGAAAGTYQTIAARPGEPDKSAVLFDFYWLITDDTPKKDDKIDNGRIRLINELKDAFSRFSARLNGKVPEVINIDVLFLAIDAITGLDDYAFNKLFAVWYAGGDGMPEEVQMLGEEIPGAPPERPPREFMFYPHRGYEGGSWEGQRSGCWNLIRKHASRVFGGQRRLRGGFR